ncbi:glycosyltransferase WbuB, partial [Mammaliicoccus sciuri]
MNIIFLTLIDFKTTNDYGIYHDFINELKKYSNKIVVVSPNERRNKHITEIISEDKVDILKVKTGNITKTNKIEKGISTLFIEKNFQKAINQYYKHTKFDLIVYSTPPMTFSKLISNLKYKNNAKTYLLLKDIFPQNAVDLKMFKSTGI